MKIFLMLISLFGHAHAAPTYGELAALKAREASERMHAELLVLNEDVAPEQTKNLRKLIVGLREQLDLFVYAYPFQGREDLWQEIRNSLDEGYAVVGEFKDLFDALGPEETADPKEVKKLRKAALEWRKLWEKNAETFVAYITKPSQNRLYSRDKKDLSRFYWGSASVVPSERLTGAQNLALLCRDLAKLAAGTWSEVKKIDELEKSLKQQEKFHDFRKRLRSLARVLRLFPEIYRGDVALLAQFDLLVEKYGAINDKIVAMEKAESKSRKKRAKALGEEIREDWKSLVKEQESMKVKALIERVLAGIR